MPQFPSRQFYLSQIVGTGTAADPWRPAVWDQAAGDKACVHVAVRAAWTVGATPPDSCIVRAYVTRTEHTTITGDARNVWLGVGEDVITATLTTSQTDAINSHGPTFVAGFTPLPYGLTVVEAIEAVTGQIDATGPPGGRWWPY